MCGVSAARWRYGRTRAIASARRLDGLGQRALGADEDATGDEELGHVDVERRPWGAERRGREVDQHRAVRVDEHVAQVEPAVRDARRVQAVDLTPQVDDGRVGHVIRVCELERVDVRLAGDHQRVAVGAECGADHLRHPHPRLSRP